MVKKFISIGLILFIFSCIPAKNIFNVVRFKSSKFTVKPNSNEDFTKVIDTSVFYQAILSDEFISEYSLQNYNNGFKFYKNGKIGFFKDVDFNDVESFNPKKADMVYYNFSGKEFIIEVVYPIPSLIGEKYKLSKREIILEKSSMDSLTIRTYKSSTTDNRITKYVKRKIPKEALNYKPDW